MKKVAKKVIIMALSLCMLFSISLTAFATDNVIAHSRGEAEQIFIDFVKNAYRNSTDFTVLDMYENDISQRFYDDTLNFYNEGNWENIHSYTTQNVRKMSYITEATSHFREDTTKNVSIENYELVTDTTGKWAKEMLYRIDGTIYYDPNTYKIASTSTPTMRFLALNWGDSFSPYWNNVATYSTTSIDRYSATFSYFFNMYSGFNDSGTVMNMDFGRCGTSFVGTTS